MEIKAIIFDFDDTIFSSSGLSFERHSIMAKKLGLRIPTEKEFFRDWGIPWIEQIKILWPEIDVEWFREIYWKNFENSFIPPIFGAIETVNKLSEKYFLAIVSSRDKKSMFHRMKQAGLDSNLFKSIVSVDDLNVFKPHPGVFNPVLKELKKFKIDKSGAIYVGDLLTDFQAAKSAGIRFVAVLTGIHKKQDFIERGLGEKFILDSIRDLPKFLAKSKF